ncbi:MAG: NUDIX hydrolase [Patescibacteria group bacterium]
MSHGFKQQNRISVVNNQDEIIGYKMRDELGTGDIHRVTALWVTDCNGNVLLGKRSANKRFAPCRWAPPVAGTVEEGETYDSNIVKEAEEELGIKEVEFKKFRKHFSPSSDGHPHFTQWYNYEINKPVEDIWFCDEHDEIKWFAPDELRVLIKKDPDMFVWGVKKFMLDGI